MLWEEMSCPTPRAELFWGQSRVVGDRQTDRADWRIVGREDEAEEGHGGLDVAAGQLLLVVVSAGLRWSGEGEVEFRQPTGRDVPICLRKPFSSHRAFGIGSLALVLS